MIKFSYTITNPPYGKGREGLLKNIILKCKEISNIIYTLGPTEYFILNEKYIGGVTERTDLNKEEYFKQVSNEISLIKIDCNSNINLNLFPKINKNPNYNPIYSPIPKLKIKEKEVDMSLAGIWMSGGDDKRMKPYKQHFYDKKQNEDDIEIWTSTKKPKYFPSSNLECLNNMKGEKSYGKWRIIYPIHSLSKSNIKLISPNELICSNDLRKFIINSKEEGEKLIKYLNKDEILNIIYSVEKTTSPLKSTFLHIPLPLFLVLPDHQDQHFSNYFKVTENTTLDYNNPDTYKIDLEKLKTEEQT